MRAGVPASLAALAVLVVGLLALPVGGLEFVREARVDLLNGPAGWSNVTGSTGTGPATRDGAGFACDTTDANAGVCILTGGLSEPSGVLHSSTWELASGHWTNLSKANPCGSCYAMGFAWDPLDHEFVEFGGQNATGFQNHYATFNLSTLTWSSWLSVAAIGSTQVYENPLAFDGSDGWIVSVGGDFAIAGTGTHKAEPWTYSFAAGVWTNRTGTAGSSWGGRYAAQLVGWSGGAILFGGEKFASSNFGDTWQLANGTWSQLTVSGGPPRARGWGSFADLTPTTAVLFGGSNQSSIGATNGYFSDTWTYTFATRTWANVTGTAGGPPEARGLSGLAQQANNTVYLTQGTNLTVQIGSTWSFSTPAINAGFLPPPGGPTLLLVLEGAVVLGVVVWAAVAAVAVAGRRR